MGHSPTSDRFVRDVVAQADRRRRAHWFEAQPARDSWADFHLHHASQRAADVDWAGLYPAVRAVQPWAITAVLSVLAVGLAFRMPARAQTAAATSAAIDTNDLPT